MRPQHRIAIIFMLCLLFLQTAAMPQPQAVGDAIANAYNNNTSNGVSNIFSNISNSPPARPSNPFSNGGSLVVARTPTPAAGVAGAILIIAGFAYGFMGKRAYYPALYLSGFLTIGVLLFIILDILQIRWHSFGQYADWIYFVIILPVSVASGFITKRIPVAAVILMGALSGFMWGVMLLFTGVGGTLTFTTHVVFILAMSGLGVATIFFMEHMALVVGTSFGGGFFVAVGIDLFACTGFVEIVNACMDGLVLPRTVDVPGPAWALFAAFGCLGMAGFYVQTRSSVPPLPDPTWNPAYWIFGAVPPSLPPPVWFKMPSNKPPAAPAAPPPPPFFSLANLWNSIGLKW
ncbi:hypothetical protein BC830DRAFT_1134812 [Chytriomyces sp. MP71]|nr:hypothetical protein BC830DRAFT_1134812 [Chytriomyces sp. MP71]